MRARFYAALLSALAWLRACSDPRPDRSQDHRDYREHQDGANAHGQQPATNVLQAEWAALQALVREIHRSEEQHQTAERNIWAAQQRAAKCLNRITAIGA